MTYPVYWPLEEGETEPVIKSMDNAFTAYERGVTTIDWANDPAFRTTEKQREQQAKAKAAGWGNGDLGQLSDKPRLSDIAPRAFGQPPKKKADAA